MVYVYVIVIELFSFMSQGGWGLWCGWWVNTCVGKGAMGMGLVVGIRSVVGVTYIRHKSTIML